jgi:hypothetical protein
MGIQVSLPGGGDPTLGFTYFVTPEMALRGDLGLNFQSLSGATQQFSLDAGLRYYFAKFEHFMPFIEPALFVSNPGANIALAVQGGIGGEYFVTDHFSFGARTGIALDMQFNQPDPTSTTGGKTTNVEFVTGTSAVFGQFLW